MNYNIVSTFFSISDKSNKFRLLVNSILSYISCISFVFFEQTETLKVDLPIIYANIRV